MAKKKEKPPKQKNRKEKPRQEKPPKSDDNGILLPILYAFLAGVGVFTLIMCAGIAIALSKGATLFGGTSSSQIIKPDSLPTQTQTQASEQTSAPQSQASSAAANSTEDPTPSQFPEVAPDPTDEKDLTSAPDNGSTVTPTSTQQPAQSERDESENINPFNTYNNPLQQETTDQWVLNTNTQKIHYPSCNEVEKIAPQNCTTSNLSEEELLAQGYSVCKRCH